MRRFIAYIVMVVAMILGVGVSFAPTFVKMKEGREFASGREIVYRLSAKDELSLDKNAAEKVAEEMRKRLDSLNVEDYSVKIGTDKDDPALTYSDTISVSFSTQDDTLFNYVSRFLSFSGGNFSLRGEEDTVFAEDVFKDSKARIVRQEGIAPYVLISVKDNEKIKEFLKTVAGEEEQSGEVEAALVPHRYADVNEGEGGEGEEKQPDVYLVANWTDDDSMSKRNENPYLSEKILCAFYHDNFWNPDSKEPETEIRFLCGSADEQGNYDLSTQALKKANQQAAFVCNMFNATTYNVEVDNLFKNVSKEGITYDYLETKASTEELVAIVNGDMRVLMSKTFVATIIAIIIVSLLMVMFFRVSALGAIANTLASVFLTFLLFLAMTPTFNISAIIGGIVVTVLSLFCEIAYMLNFRNEVYKGRSLKKSNQEAMKKTNLLALDASIVTAFGGLMFYFLGGEALKPFGVITFFGSIISLLMFLLVYRLLNYLVTNTTSFQNKYHLFNIHGEKVPNLATEEKPAYVAPYEKTNFVKRSKVAGIIGAILLTASVVGIAVFGASGFPLNTKNATKNTTTIYTSIVADEIKLDVTTFNDSVLKNVYLNGRPLDSTKENVELKKQISYNLDEEMDDITYFFVANIPAELNNNNVAYKSGELMVNVDTLGIAIESLVRDYEVFSDSVDIAADVRITNETVNTPNQASIAIATSVMIAGACFYFAFRYRPSRALAALISTAGVTAISYGFFALTRIATTGVTAVMLPLVAVSSLIISLFFMNKERELLREEKGNLDAAKRHEIMSRAVSLSAVGVFSLSLIAAYLSVNYFGFGPNTFVFLFAGSLIGVVLTVVACLTILGPLACVFGKWFSRIKMPKIRRKNPTKVSSKPKTSEPQETIFIGIND